MARKKVSTTKENKVKGEDLQIKEEKIEVGFIHFKFPITRDEANAVINQKGSIVARKMKKYVNSLLQAGCKKFLESNPDKDVKNCKILDDKD
jgi:hypothetical protein